MTPPPRRSPPFPYTTLFRSAELDIDGHRLVLCHYPFRSWNKMGKGVIDLHGHSHGKLKELPRQYDVGVDVFAYRPVTLETILRSEERRVGKECSTGAS